MRPKRITLGALATPDADGICLSQTPGAAGNLTIAGALASGGVATLDIPRRVEVAGGSNESAKTFTIYGTDRNGITISESIAGPNAGVSYTLNDFKTVTRVAVDAATTGAVTVGTNQVASSQWIPADVHITPFSLSLDIQMSTGASFTYQVEHTLDNPFGTPGAYLKPWTHPDLVGETTAQQGTYDSPITAHRYTITAYTGGILTGTSVQAGT